MRIPGALIIGLGTFVACTEPKQATSELDAMPLDANAATALSPYYEAPSEVVRDILHVDSAYPSEAPSLRARLYTENTLSDRHAAEIVAAQETERGFAMLQRRYPALQRADTLALCAGLTRSWHAFEKESGRKLGGLDGFVQVLPIADTLQYSSIFASVRATRTYKYGEHIDNHFEGNNPVTQGVFLVSPEVGDAAYGRCALWAERVLPLR